MRHEEGSEAMDRTGTSVIYALRALAAIALNTFRQAIRSKVLGSLLFFAVLIILASLLLGELSLHEERRVVRDLSLVASVVFAAVIAIQSTVTLLQVEIERRTIYTILSKPIRRWQFLLGKCLGVILLLGLVVAGLSLISAATLLLQQGEPDLVFAQAFAMVWLQMVILVAVGLFFSSFMSPLLAGFTTAAIFVAGNLVSQLESMRALLRENGNPLSALLDLIIALLPNLESLNLSYEMTYQMTVPASYLGAALWYAFSYSAVALALAMVVFSRRDFA